MLNLIFFLKKFYLLNCISLFNTVAIINFIFMVAILKNLKINYYNNISYLMKTKLMWTSLKDYL